MNSFKNLLLRHIKDNFPELDPHLSEATDPLPNRSGITVLYVHFSSAFNIGLIGKRNTLSLSITLCQWILDFLTNRTQTVQIGSHTSFMLVLNTGAPQDCMLWSVSTEERQKTSWLETSQSDMVHARPTTGRVCSRTSLAHLQSLRHISRWDVCTEARGD